MVRCDGGEEGRPARRARGGSAPTRMERRRRLDAEEERRFSPGRDAARGSAARTLEVGSARPVGLLPKEKAGIPTGFRASKLALNAQPAYYYLPSCPGHL